MAKYYITTTAPYVNAEPHIGFALEIVQADCLARWKRASGEEVLFGMGTDEHGKKIWEKAKVAGQEPQQYTDQYAEKFALLKTNLNLSYDLFTRTTDPKHIKAAQTMWERCRDNGFIEKGVYRAKYCVGCELEKTDSELVDGKCPLHPTGEIELIEEENYFFRFSDPRIKEALLKHYEDYTDFVVPNNRLKEIKNFVQAGLTDFSISRLAEKMPWGVPVPGDEKHVMYVWFDALTFYATALGWPDNEAHFEEYWGTVEEPRAIQVAGKDNLRQQAAMWQAMLVAAKMPRTRQILIHGFITSGGQKMSKSLGNVINPLEYSQKYGTDALRYYLLAKMAPFEDSDFTQEKFELAYVADLQNGLGNLISRVTTMASDTEVPREKTQISPAINNCLQSYDFDKAMAVIWEQIAQCNALINEKQVWKLEGETKQRELAQLIGQLRQIQVDLEPFLPETAQKINLYLGHKIAKAPPLFPRIGT